MLGAMGAAAAAAVVAPLIVGPATTAEAAPIWNEAAMIDILNHPNMATHATYDTADSAGNHMEAASIIQLRAGAAYKYACVYHTPIAVTGGWKFQVHVAGSNNLTSWTHLGVLIDNADMPKILRVSGSDWIVVTHEQWSGPGPASTAPCNVTFRLFYTDADLLARTIRSTYTMPIYGTSGLNGTPSFYDAVLVFDGTFYAVNGQYGFHDWNGTKDVNDSTTINQMFNPAGTVAAFPATATGYNDDFINMGVTGNIGDRDTIAPSFGGRYNVQEGNIGMPGQDFGLWRMWLYKYSEPTKNPTGAGTVSALSPVTPFGSTSFGNPCVSIVDAPSGGGQVMWVSYFLFSEGAGNPSEMRSLIYWTNI